MKYLFQLIFPHILSYSQVMRWEIQGSIKHHVFRTVWISYHLLKFQPRNSIYRFYRELLENVLTKYFGGYFLGPTVLPNYNGT